MEKLFDSWMETRFLDLARLIGQRVKDLSDALSHPYGPVGYSVEEFYVIGVALAGIYNEKGGEGVAQAVSPDAYSVYKNGLGNEAGQLATARLGIDLAIIIFVSRCPYKAVASEGAVISEKTIVIEDTIALNTVKAAKREAALAEMAYQEDLAVQAGDCLKEYSAW